MSGQITRAEAEAQFAICMRRRSRNAREGGYCGKVNGNHYRAGHMSQWKWDTPYPTLRQWTCWKRARFIFDEARTYLVDSVAFHPAPAMN